MHREAINRRNHPFGVAQTTAGVNLSLFSGSASRAELRLPHRGNAARPRPASIWIVARTAPTTTGPRSCRVSQPVSS